MITPKVKVRGKVNTAHVRKRYKAGAVKSLDAIGSMIRSSAKREFSSRSPKKQPTWTRVGQKDGRPVLAMEFRPPKAGKVTSWKNPRGRGATQTGFLRTMIEYRRDDRKDSVVIGPMAKATWLNKLQEFGGSGRRVLKLIGTYTSTAGGRDSRGRFLKNNNTSSGVLKRFNPPSSLLGGGRPGGRDSRGRFRSNIGTGAFVGVWVDPAHTRRRGEELASARGRIRPGRFMKKGLDKKRERIAETWRNKITGP